MADERDRTLGPSRRMDYDYSVSDSRRRTLSGSSYGLSDLNGRSPDVDWDAMAHAQAVNRAGNAMARGLITPKDYTAVAGGDQKNYLQKMIFDLPTPNDIEITNEATGGFLETLGDTLGIGSIVMGSAAQASTKALMGQGHFIGNFAEAWANRTSFINFADDHGHVIGLDSDSGQFWGGLAADILLDPLTYMTLGVSGGAKVALSQSAKATATKGSRLAATEAGTKLTTNRLGQDIYRLSAQQLQPDFIKWKNANAADGLSRSEHLLDATEAATWNERIIENAIENFDFLMAERSRRLGFGSTARSVRHRFGQVTGSGAPGFHTMEAGIEAAGDVAARSADEAGFLPSATADDMFQETASAAFKDRGIKSNIRGGMVSASTKYLGEGVGEGFTKVFRLFDRDFGRPPGIVQAVKETENIISQQSDKATTRYAQVLGRLSGDERETVSRLVEEGYDWDEMGLGTLSGVLDYDDRIRSAVEFVRAEMDDILNIERKAGFEVGNVANYITHVYALKPKQREMVAATIFRNGEESVNSVNKFRQSRLIASIADGEEAFGKGSMVLDALEVLRIRKKASLEMLHRTELNKRIIRNYGIPGLLIQTQNQGLKGSIIRGFLRRNTAGVAEVLNVEQVYQSANGNLARLGFREGDSQRNLAIMRFLMRPADDVADDATRAQGRLTEDGRSELARIVEAHGIDEKTAERLLSHTWDKKGKTVKVGSAKISTVIGEAIPSTFKYADTKLRNAGVWTASKVHQVLRGKTQEFKVEDALNMLEDTGHPQWDVLLERMTHGKKADSFRMSPVIGFFGGLHAYLVKNLDAQLPGFDPRIEEKIKNALVDRLAERAAGVDKGISMGASKRAFLIRQAKVKVRANFDEALSKGFSSMTEDITVRKYRPQVSQTLVDLAKASRRAAGNFRSDAPAADWQKEALLKEGVLLGFDSDTLSQLYKSMFNKGSVETAAEADLVLEMFHTLNDDTVVARMLGAPGGKGALPHSSPRQMGPWTGSMVPVTFTMPLQESENILPELMDAANRQGETGIDVTKKTEPEPVSLFDDRGTEVAPLVSPKVKRRYDRVATRREQARTRLTLAEGQVKAVDEQLKALPQDMVEKNDKLKRLRRVKGNVKFITTNSRTRNKKIETFDSLPDKEKSELLHDTTTDLVELFMEEGMDAVAASKLATEVLSPAQRIVADPIRIGVWKKNVERAQAKLDETIDEKTDEAFSKFGDRLKETLDSSAEAGGEEVASQVFELAESLGITDRLIRSLHDDLMSEIDATAANLSPEYKNAMSEVARVNKMVQEKTGSEAFFVSHFQTPRARAPKAGEAPATWHKFWTKLSDAEKAEVRAVEKLLNDLPTDSMYGPKAQEEPSKLSPRFFGLLAEVLTREGVSDDLLETAVGAFHSVHARVVPDTSTPPILGVMNPQEIAALDRLQEGVKKLASKERYKKVKGYKAASETRYPRIGATNKTSRVVEKWRKTRPEARRAEAEEVIAKNQKLIDDAERSASIKTAVSSNQAASVANKLLSRRLRASNKDWRDRYVGPWALRRDLLKEKNKYADEVKKAVKEAAKAEKKMAEMRSEVGMGVADRIDATLVQASKAVLSPMDQAPTPMVDTLSGSAEETFEQIGQVGTGVRGDMSPAGTIVQDMEALPREAAFVEAKAAYDSKVAELRAYMGSPDVDPVIARGKKAELKRLKEKVRSARDELGYNPTAGSKVDSIKEPKEFAKNQKIEVFLPEPIADILKEYRGETRMRELDGTPVGNAINNILAKYDSMMTYYKSNILLAFTGTWARNAFSSALMSVTSNGINLLDPRNGFEKMGQFVKLMRYFLYKHTDYAAARGLSKEQVEGWLKEAGSVEVVSRATGRKLTIEQLADEAMISGVTKSMHASEAMDIMARGQGIGATATIGAVAGGLAAGPLGALAGAAGGAALGANIGRNAPATGRLAGLSRISDQSVGGGVSGAAAGSAAGAVAGLGAGVVDPEQDFMGGDPTSWTSLLGGVAGAALGARRPYAVGDQTVPKRQGGDFWGIPVVGKARHGADKVTGLLQSQWMPFLRAGETVTETPFRLAAFLGGFHETGSMLQATNRVTRALNDWNNLSVFERRLMRRVVPFYAWTKHALAFTWRESINNPGRLTAPHKVAESWLVSHDYDPEDVPEFFHEKLAILAEAGEDGMTLYSGAGAPQEDVAALVNALLPNRGKTEIEERKEFLSGAVSRGPFGVISVLEGVFNTDTFTGRAIQSDADISYFRDGRRWDEAPGWLQHIVGYRPATEHSKAVVDPNMAWLLGELPVSRFIDMMKKVHGMSPEEKRNLNTRSLALSFLGVNAYRYDRETQKKFVNRAKVDRLNKLLIMAGTLDGYTRFNEVSPTQKSSRRGLGSRGRGSRWNSR